MLDVRRVLDVQHPDGRRRPARDGKAAVLPEKILPPPSSRFGHLLTQDLVAKGLTVCKSTMRLKVDKSALYEALRSAS